MECCVGVSTETVLQIDKFYIVVIRIFKLTFWTVVLRWIETFIQVKHSLRWKATVRNVSLKILLHYCVNLSICRTVFSVVLFTIFPFLCRFVSLTFRCLLYLLVHPFPIPVFLSEALWLVFPYNKNLPDINCFFVGTRFWYWIPGGTPLCGI